MIRIPDEVVEAAAKADYEAWRDYMDLRDETLDWECYAEEEREGRRICARASIAAALSAWPGIEIEVYDNDKEGVFLPLPQEPRDDA